MKNKPLKIVVVGLLVLITLSACGTKTDTTAGSTKRTAQTN